MIKPCNLISLSKSKTNPPAGNANTAAPNTPLIISLSCSFICCLSKSVSSISPLAALIKRVNAALVSLPSCFKLLTNILNFSLISDILGSFNSVTTSCI